MNLNFELRHGTENANNANSATKNVQELNTILDNPKLISKNYIAKQPDPTTVPALYIVQNKGGLISKSEQFFQNHANSTINKVKIEETINNLRNLLNDNDSSHESKYALRCVILEGKDAATQEAKGGYFIKDTGNGRLYKIYYNPVNVKNPTEEHVAIYKYQDINKPVEIKLISLDSLSKEKNINEIVEAIPKLDSLADLRIIQKKLQSLDNSTNERDKISFEQKKAIVDAINKRTAEIVLHNDEKDNTYDIKCEKIKLLLPTLDDFINKAETSLPGIKINPDYRKYNEDKEKFLKDTGFKNFEELKNSSKEQILLKVLLPYKDAVEDSQVKLSGVKLFDSILNLDKNLHKALSDSHAHMLLNGAHRDLVDSALKVCSILEPEYKPAHLGAEVSSSYLSLNQDQSSDSHYSKVPHTLSQGYAEENCDSSGIGEPYNVSNSNAPDHSSDSTWS